MAAVGDMWLLLGVNIGLLVCLLCPNGVSASGDLQYCSFFNNRAPKAQPGLKNCTWFKENSCCMQQEIQATFGNVKPLKGANLECQKYINYLMCYICAPNQNLFYKSERLTVCEEFCDRLFDACRSATLKGSQIGQLHSSGGEFCESRRFDVAHAQCFTFDTSLDTSGSDACSSQPICLIAAFILYTALQSLALDTNASDMLQKIANQKDNCRKRKQPIHCQGRVRKSTCVKSKVPPMFGLPSPVFRLDKTLTTIVLCVVLLPYGAGALTADDVKLWAERLSVDLTDFAKRGLRYEEIQQLYENAQYATEYVNGTAKILELREKLGDYFSRKKQLALQLAEWVRQLHDTWWLNRDTSSYDTLYYNHQDPPPPPAPSTGGTGGFQNYHSNDLMRSMNPDAVGDEDSVEVDPPPRLEDLSLDIYKDADLPHRLPQKLMHYNRDFGRVIMDGYSVVKIPDDLDRSSREIMDTVEWTARLDEAFIKNRESDPSLRECCGPEDAGWQYFGSSTGVHRQFPGHEWPANFIGFKEDYDPRTRPWYVAATSGPKDMVLVLDGSASMRQAGSMDRMKKIAQNVLSTLTRHDNVNVVVSRSSYWDADGTFHEYGSEVLLQCSQASLVPATPTHRKQLTMAIDALGAAGGSDHIDAFNLAFMLMKNMTKGECQSLIIFITDGALYDDDQRCTAGYHKFDDQNRKHYVKGELCEYDFDRVVHTVNVLQYQIPRKAHLFTFLTQEGHQSEQLPGQLACNNQGAMATVTRESEIFQQMSPYFRFLEASSGAEEPLWTSPYLDKAGLGLMVTIAVPVFSNVSSKHLGVVGIDTPLEHLETLIHHMLWGTAYAFMIDRRDSSTIIHPFAKPSAQLLEDPSFIPITSLEMDGGQPQQFHTVLAAMQEQKTGDTIITENARRAISLHNSLLWRKAEYAHYFYTDIPDSDYSIAFNLAKADETFQYAEDPIVNGPLSYLHEMEGYLSLVHPYPDFYQQLQPISDDVEYPALKISKAHSVVKLAPRCFCDPAAYLESSQPTLQNIHNYINTFTPTYDMHCPRGTYRTDVRPDVKLTAQLESLWLHREPAMQNQVVWTYMGTMSGIMRIYPGVELNRDFDPTKRIWYHRSEANRGKLAASSVYLDNMPQIGKVVTLSWAVHKSKPLTPPDCTATLRDYGCPCDHHHHCKSDYCYRRSCADDLIQGVVAMDLRYDDFQQRVENRIQEVGTGEHCNQQTQCPDGHPCHVRCYVINDMANLVMSLDFSDIANHERDLYEEVSLASREGYIFGQLLRRHIFESHSRIDYQGVCKRSTDIPQTVPVDHYWTASNTATYHIEPGPLAPFQNEYGCIQEYVHYSANKTTLYNGSVFVSGDLAHDPCSSGIWYFSSIVETNLFLLVVKDYRKLQSSLNFNCHIQNSVFRPGSYLVQSRGCTSSLSNQQLFPRTCTKAKRVPIPCGFSGGVPIRPVLGLCLACLLVGLLFSSLAVIAMNPTLVVITGSAMIIVIKVLMDSVYQTLPIPVKPLKSLASVSTKSCVPDLFQPTHSLIITLLVIFFVASLCSVISSHSNVLLSIHRWMKPILLPCLQSRKLPADDTVPCYIVPLHKS